MSFRGADITRPPPFRRVERGMALVPQGRRIFPSLSVRENLDVARGGQGRWNRERVYELFPRLRERAAHRRQQALGRRAADAGDRPGLMCNPDCC